jgi:adenosylmethionine-8-amino-7-oxononanoate aminotransferase
MWPPALAELEALLRERAGQIAALIVEPLVQGAAGMAMYDPSYSKARALCDRYRVHLIADEIAVGCGRTGTFFAWEQARGGDAVPAHAWPDFLCLSKGITGGYLPLSLVLSRPRSSVRSWPTTSRAASCIRTRTPATAGLPRRAGHAGPVRIRRCARRQPRARAMAGTAMAGIAADPRSATCASAA